MKIINKLSLSKLSKSNTRTMLRIILVVVVVVFVRVRGEFAVFSTLAFSVL